MLETVLNTGRGYLALFATILEGVLSVSHVKKIVMLATAISVGGITFAVVGRTSAGEAAEQESRTSQVSDGPAPVDDNRGRTRNSASPDVGKDPHVVAIESKLEERISLSVDKKPLEEAVGFLQTYTGLNIVFDPRALSQTGINASSPVSLSAQQVPLKTVIKLLLRPLGLTYKIEDEVVLITSPNNALRAPSPTARYPKTYYVGDLVACADPGTMEKLDTAGVKRAAFGCARFEADHGADPD